MLYPLQNRYSRRVSKRDEQETSDARQRFDAAIAQIVDPQEPEHPYQLQVQAALPDDFPVGEWVKVTGRDLDHPVYVRIAPRPSGAGLLVSGVAFGADGPVEISPRALRALKLPEVLRQVIYEHRLTETASMSDNVARAMRWMSLHDAEPVPSEPRRRGVAPSDQDLRRFAEHFKANLVAEPRKAMTQTARDLRISRSTANRWAALCRQRDYLGEGQ